MELKISEMKFFLIAAAIISFQINSIAQQGKDSIKIKSLDSVIVNAQLKTRGTTYLPDIKGMYIFAGKKTNEIELSDKTPGLELNNARTAFAKIPGLTMWEMDG
jgi:Fe(3+) dicitrate transport protein